MTFEKFENFLLSEDCYDNHDVSYIDYDGKQHYLNHDNFWSYYPKVCYLLTTNYTIKVEQYEKVLDIKNHTAHIFYNKKNGPSFDIHTDPTDVLIECLDGIKWLEIDGKPKKLNRYEHVIIPANTPHRALNYEKALMISYGINDTETLTRIHQND